ncbi:general vesicular transport factor p115 isoform X1 [Onychomys torridus]|uniref:general vesicular transport factor p115 isoform X1 n=1 Tax=Onychomys torridus TaxID=38674 RepID=UPI00167F3890|nr:general vesicular transport factor p115 isoform X1 [Onychomys torridus]
MNFLRGVMGGQSAGPQHTEAETIQKLCDRVASSTLLDDRRNAVRALKSLSKKYRLEVGIQAMEHLIHVLQTDRSDSEIIAYALDTLYNIISNDEEEEVDDVEEENSTRPSEDLGSQFTEIFIKQPENVTLLLSLLEEFDFHVRWPGVRLLTSLLKQLGPPVQQIVLVSPMGVSRLMDLLADSREIIRNDGVLLLQALTRSNGAIQKIVAFENAFERLLDIITEEGNSDGGIVVEDCLILLQNLLKNNNSNQNFFKEGSYIQRMKPWFEVGDENSGWSAQKVTNLHLMLQLVRVLVSPTNPPGATSSCQKAMFQCGLLQQLCTILMATGIPADILTETINTVSEVIRGCQVNQDYFASVNAPSNPPRPAIVVLLMSMVNERQPFVLRCAVLYCFQCFLYRNQKGQGEIVATLLPSTIDATGNSVSAGQLLCGGLFSTDSLSNWCAAVALAHALQGNATQKEQLLRVQLATSIGNPPVSLLQQCTNILSQGDKIDRRGSKIQTRVGLLMLLCTWLSSCPIAVTHFLHNSANVPFLTGQIAENLGEEEQLVQGLCALLLGISIYFNDNSLENYMKEKLKQLIEKRIGKENFIEKLGFISKHELYSRASQKPQPNFPSPEYMIFDHEFTKLVKELEGVITKAIYKSSEEDKKEEEVKKTLEQHDNIVTHYKNMIREQDLQLEELKQQVSTLRCQNEQLQTAVTQHKDQYNLLKVQLGKDNHHQGSHSDGAQVNGMQPEEISRLREEVEELKHLQGCLQSQLAEKDSVIEHLKSSQVSALNEQTSAAASPRDSEQVIELKQELSTLKSQLNSQSLEITRLQAENHELLQRAEVLAKSVPVQGESENVVAAKTTDVEGRLSALLQETKELKNEIKALSEEKTAIKKQLDSSNSTIAILQTEKDKLDVEVTDSKKEQDDLLVLLADQDQKILSLKSKLKDLGHPVEEEDESGDQEDDDDEMDDGDKDQDI